VSFDKRAVKLRVDTSLDLERFFEAWDQRNDYSARGAEEFAEAGAAVLQYRRGKITFEELLGELADSIIAAAHIAYTTHEEYPIGYGFDRLNDMIVEKLEKGMTQV
jgi:uncharacterized iron-regulated protein